ncbi:MAG: ParM/StbA family protein [Candidatus Accumulibacter sp.]|uniref:ParM/StbA family protein n=1 Tax=Accumulibacter sp. TaxID=2053492 RepID=UPI00258A5A82|nr:ParM/StbA family protein [Accumulibacter sp.]MBK8113306.1 ParM/StbA family protein [Accumulibacter sp.]
MTNYIALDAGFGNTRLYGSRGSVVLQSLVATNGTQTVSQWAIGDLKKIKAKPILISSAHGDYYVGPGAHQAGRPVENLDLDRMTGPETKALLYGALSQYKTPAAASLIIALPIALAQGPDGDRVKDQARALLVGDHTWQATIDGQRKRRRLTIDDVLVTSQPAGAMFDYLLSADGTMSADMAALRKTKTFGILSLGFNTIEMMIVDEGKMLPKSVSGDTFGVRRLLELLNADGAYSLGEIDTRLRAGKLDYTAALDRWSRDVLGQIEKHWDRTLQRRFAAVYVVGGGAILMRDALLTKFKDRLVIADDPILSIARGCYKYTLHKYGN